jgi:hypothetical protein
VFVTTTEEAAFAGRSFWVLNGSLKETGYDHSRESSEVR